MIKFLIYFNLILPLFVFGEIRTWSDKNGNTIEAEYVNSISGKIILRDSRGKVYKLDPSKLSKADRLYLSTSVPPRLELVYKKSVEDINGYSYESDIIRGSLTIFKRNKEQYDKLLKVVLLVIGYDEERDAFVVLDRAEDNFRFKNKNEFFLQGDSVRIYDWDDSYSSGKEGVEYASYFAAVIDSSGNLISMKTGRKNFEDHAQFLLTCESGSYFSKDFQNLKKYNRAFLGY